MYAHSQLDFNQKARPRHCTRHNVHAMLFIRQAWLEVSEERLCNAASRDGVSPCRG